MNNSVGKAREGFRWEGHTVDLQRTSCGEGKLASKFIMLLPLPRYTHILKILRS